MNIDRTLKLTRWQYFQEKKHFSQQKNKLKQDDVAGGEMMSGGPGLLGRNKVSPKVWEQRNDVAKPEIKIANLFRKIKVSYQVVQGWFEDINMEDMQYSKRHVTLC